MPGKSAGLRQRGPRLEPLEPRLLLDAGQVVINEIMYHPGLGEPGEPGYVAENLGEEYIELYNKGAGAVNLKDWKFTQGVALTFPDVKIAENDYLVVAADVTAFHAKYPTVTAQVVGGWTGHLSNSGQDIELEDAAAARVDFVPYSTEGDWGLRRQGEAFFADPKWFRGWEWTSPADAGGKSLELVNAALSNEYGQNWAAGITDQGTPGAPNSVASTDAAPIILDVKHYPCAAKSTEPITITARIVEKSGAGASVSVWHRRVEVDSSAPFVEDAMYDDGLHGDGAAGDGVYGYVMSAIPTNGAIVEYYIRAADSGGKSRTWPAPTDDAGTQGANALFQVDDTVYTGSQPIYRVIMPKAEWDDWNTLMTGSDYWYGWPSSTTAGRHSNAQMNATLVVIDAANAELRYNVGVRNRGAGTRSASPHNFRFNLVHDQPLNGYTALECNTRSTYGQLAGNAIASAAGIPAPYGAAVQVRVNGSNLAQSGSPMYGSYFLFEPYDGEWVDRHFPEDPSGNLYKGMNAQGGHLLSTSADLTYRGANPDSYRGAYPAPGPYDKQTNVAADDWSDLFQLTDVMYNPADPTPGATYAQEVEAIVNVDEWLRYFAVNSLLGNGENGLGGVGSNGRIVGDDYSMYDGVLDPRFQLLIHDLDSVLDQGDYHPGSQVSLFPTIYGSSTTYSIDRFLKDPAFAPRYYAMFKDLIETTFSAAQLDPMLDNLLGGWVPASVIQSMKDFAAARRAYVLSQIPQSISVTTAPPLDTASGYFKATAATANLAGLADAIDTRSVKVNGQAATWTAWTATWSISSVPLNPGINRILIQAFDGGGTETDRSTVDIWYDKGSTTPVAGGTLAADTTWTAAGGPYAVTGSLTIPSGVTLTIEPGASVYLADGANLTVSSGGRLLAEGTDTQRIVITRAPESTSSWGGITVNGGAAAPETRITYAHIVYNGTAAIHSSGGTLFLDHLTFGTTTYQYFSLDSSSFIIQDCVFPAPTASFEPGHGSGGIKAGGRGLFLRNYFGAPRGNNDVIDFTGGNRPGQPVLQFIDNVFTGATDDVLDLDGTDAWIEGNIFMHVHKNGPLDTASAVSGGNTGSDTSEITILGNLFYDVDQAAMAKQGDFFTLINNTIVHQTHEGGLDTDGGVVCLADAGTTEAAGMYLEGNIVYDAENLVRYQTASLVTFTNNLMSLAWSGPGSGNTVGDPLFRHVPQMSETVFADWRQAQVMRQWLGLRPGSPAIGAGPDGTDMGGVKALGVSISGEPVGVTNQTTATLTVGVNRTGNGIPTAGWPNGSGYTSCKWRLDGGAWSAETPISTALVLTGLANGPHTVDVVGRNDADWYQDATELGQDATITHSRAWTVDTSHLDAPAVIINEVLASNVSAAGHNTAPDPVLYPDVIELYNTGPGPITLAGMTMTDNPAVKNKFTFASGTTQAEGTYKVLYGGTDAATPADHLGFSLKESGDTLYLYDSGGNLVDSVTFGFQLADKSIGRKADGTWGLAEPTFGAANVILPTGDPTKLKINEWLADGQVRIDHDFVEIYNPDPLPVDMGGLYLTDRPRSTAHQLEIHLGDPPDPLKPAPYVIAALSFIAPSPIVGGLALGGYRVFNADGDTQAGADHADFRLDYEWGEVGLLDAAGFGLDRVVYQTQTPDVSEGRIPLGSGTLARSSIPTPGLENPGTVKVVNSSATLPIFDIANATYQWRYNDTGTNLHTASGTKWYEFDYVDTGWGLSSGILNYEKDTTDHKQTFPSPWVVNKVLAGDPNHKDGSNRLYPYACYYFRTHFTLAGDPTQVTSLEGTTFLDDGAILYLNGTEIERLYINDGVTPSYTMTANTTMSGTATARTYSISLAAFPGLLRQGENVLAVEVHQSGTGSSDATWAASLTAKATAETLVRDVSIPANIVALADYLRISEMMYNAVGGSDYEYIELGNTSAAATLDLAGVRVTNGIDYTFSDADPARNLAPGQYIVVAANQTTFRSRYGSAPVLAAGVYAGKLSDNGENLTLKLPAPYDAAMLRFDYQPTWYPAASGGGHSIVIVDPAGQAASWGKKIAWKASAAVNGSPGADEPPPSTGTVIINELMTHSDQDPPLGPGDWIELYNTSATDAVDLGGWYLSDTGADLHLYQIPADTVIGPHEYKVFTERDDFGDDFALSELGDELHLTNPSGAYHEIANFTAGDREVTFGRYTNSTGVVEYVPMSAATPGQPNAAPLVGPVIISEIMYHPPAAGDEFIELKNITPADVALHDANSPANGWMFTNGVEFAFDAGDFVPANGYALVVGGDPAAFRDKYGIPASVPIYGPYVGNLDNGGATVTLKKPGDPEPDTGLVPYYLVDHVLYDDVPPWPTAPDGTGPSLGRASDTAYGNEVLNWTAGPAYGTPGGVAGAAAPRIINISLNGRNRGAGGVDPSGLGVRTVQVTFSKSVAFLDTDVQAAAVTFPGGSEHVEYTLAPVLGGSGTRTMTLVLLTAVIDMWVKVALSGNGTLRDLMGHLLDGEPAAGGNGLTYIRDSFDLPTGDGVAGGGALFYVGSLRGDFSGNGAIDEADKDAFLAKWRAGDLDADFRGAGFGVRPPDGRITIGDIDGFTSIYLAARAANRQLAPLPSTIRGQQSGGITERPPLPAAPPTADVLAEAAGQVLLVEPTSLLGPSGAVLAPAASDPLLGASSSDNLRVRPSALASAGDTSNTIVLRI